MFRTKKKIEENIKEDLIQKKFDEIYKDFIFDDPSDELMYFNAFKKGFLTGENSMSHQIFDMVQTTITEV